MSLRRMTDRVFTLVVAGCALLALAVLTFTLAAVWSRGAASIDVGFLTSATAEAGAAGGIVWHILGTTLLVGTAAAVALPFATGLGLWTEIWSGPRLRRWIDSALEGLNAVPSIVYGILGLAILSRAAGLEKSWLAGGIVLGIMILPTLTVSFVEKLRGIPRHTIEAAAGLGLDRSALATSVHLPQGWSGLATGLVLGLARSAGETAPIMFTAVVFAGATMPRGIVDSPVLALPYHIFVLAQDSFDPEMLGNAWGAAVVLLAGVIAMSAVALPFRLRAHEEANRV